MTCAMPPGGHCPNPATVTVRIANASDWPLCDGCLAILEHLGMAFRRLGEKVPIPAWRRLSAAKELTPYSGRPAL
jgi:hypothetical protein